MASSTVKATWIGPFTAELPDGTTVEHGQSAEISREQAEDSGHWQTAASKKKDAE